MQQVHGYPIMAVNPFTTDGTIGTAVWSNDLGQSIKVFGTGIWMGLGIGAIADMYATLRLGDQIIQSYNWSHYAEPTAPSNVFQNVAPNYFSLPTLGYMSLEYYALTLPPHDPPQWNDIAGVSAFIVYGY